MAYHGIRSDDVSYLYPEYRGQHLEEINNLMVNLDNFKRSGLALSSQMSMVATQIDLARTTIHGLETEKQIAHLQNLKEILDRTQQIVVAVLNTMNASSFWGAASLTAQATAIAAIQSMNIYYTEQIDDLQMEQIEIEKQSALIQCYQSLSSINTSIQETVLDIFDAYYGTTSSMERIMALEIEAQQLAERVGFSDDPKTARVYYVNTVMRMRYNTLYVRYHEAFERARILAMVAKKAIEFRFGVDLMDMTEDMILVPAPKTWAAQICTMQGIDYEVIRESDPEAIEDGYADSYIGDYVQKLEDFAESYPMDYPFMEADDIAVISLKNDYFNEEIPCEERESTNLLYYSEDLASFTQIIDEDTEELLYILGWQEDRSECESDDPCIEVWEDAPAACGESPLPPCDLIGRADHLLEPGEEAKPGFIYQVVRDLHADWYVLGWKHLFIAGSTPVPYGVRVSKVVDEVETPLEWHEFSPTSTNEWEDGFIAFQLDVDASVKIEVHPSYSDDIEDPPGDVWLWGFQLNRFEFVTDTDGLMPMTYEKTNDGRSIRDAACPDLDGSDFRKEFTHICVGETECYYETQFSVNLQDIENGSYFTSDVISTNNYNYRHKSIALNFVGTNIKDCTRPDATSSCYENAFIPYTLIHGGVVSIRNHEFQYEDFSMVTGKIEHGKGLAAEVVITNPLTGSQPSLLDPYMNAELRGRPIQGQYTLRIYDTPELDWERIEDIQLVWDYHYWTKFGI
jgi:hypothetical protein